MDHVDEIKRRTTIEEVVGSYIDLKPAGKNFKALCPFHQEKTPSFVVTPERNSFYCFGCNRGGDIFTFVQEFEGVDFRGALKILAERTGVELRPLSPQEKTQRDEKELLFDILEDATQAFEKEYKRSKHAQEYIKQRGISEKARAYFRIGYAPDAWQFTEKTLSHIPVDKLEKSGLIKASSKRPGTHYDRFRNRVMFPMADSSARIIGFSGRTLSEDDKTAKYINSPETPIFKKSEALFGIDKAKGAIRKHTFATLVEGQVDLVLAHDKGFPNTVASSGTALREAVTNEAGSAAFTLLKRLTKNLVIAFDSDASGRDAAIKNARHALALGMDVKIAQLPNDEDPADILSRDPSEWREIIRSSLDVIEFEFKTIKNRTKNSGSLLKEIENNTFETIRMVKSVAQRDLYLAFLSDQLGINKEALVSDFKHYLSLKPKKESVTSHSKTKTTTPPSNKSQQDKVRLAGLMGMLEGESTDTVDITELKKEVVNILGQQPEAVLKSLSPPEQEHVLINLEREFPKIENRIYSIKEAIKQLTLQQLIKEAKLAREQISEYERSGLNDKAKQSTEHYFSIQQRIDSLKRNHA